MWIKFLISVLALGLAASSSAFSLSSRSADRLKFAEEASLNSLHLVEGISHNNEEVKFKIQKFQVFNPAKTITVHKTSSARELNYKPHHFFQGHVVDEESSSSVLLAIHPDSGVITGKVTRGGKLFKITQVKDQIRLTLNTDKPDDFVPPFTPCEQHNLPQVPDEFRAPSYRSHQNRLQTRDVDYDEEYVVEVAIESDNEFFELFDSEDEAVEYLEYLFADISAIYKQDINVRVVLGDIELHEDEDPYSNGGSTASLLYEFGERWSEEHEDKDRDLAHFMSGQNLGGGVAWLAALCAPDRCLNGQCTQVFGGYGLSANLNGAYDLSNPSSLWDVVVVAHEIGHNLGSPHSHCYNNVPTQGEPVVDGCWNQEPGCFNGAPSVPENGGGTLMSYCHLQPGGLGNVALSFGEENQYGVQSTRIRDLMRSTVLDISGSCDLESVANAGASGNSESGNAASNQSDQESSAPAPSAESEPRSNPSPTEADSDQDTESAPKSNPSPSDTASDQDSESEQTAPSASAPNSSNAPSEQSSECGNDVCDAFENCFLCPEDCGSCPESCGDKFCSEDEDCDSCPEDCGICPPTCGDKICDETEDCETCEEDCGECVDCDEDDDCDDDDKCTFDECTNDSCHFFTSCPNQCSHRGTCCLDECDCAFGWESESDCSVGPRHVREHENIEDTLDDGDAHFYTIALFEFSVDAQQESTTTTTSEADTETGTTTQASDSQRTTASTAAGSNESGGSESLNDNVVDVNVTLRVISGDVTAYFGFDEVPSDEDYDYKLEKGWMELKSVRTHQTPYVTIYGNEDSSEYSMQVQIEEASTELSSVTATGDGTKKSKDGSHTKWIIIAASIAGVALVAAIGFLIFKRARANPRGSYRKVELFEEDTGAYSPPTL